MSLQFLNGSSKVFAAANPFEVSEYVRANVGTHSLRLSNAGHASASLSHRRAGMLDLCRLRYGAQARILSEGLGDIYHAQFILHGHCRYTLANTSLDLSAGHVLVINPDEPIDLTYSDDCEKFILRIPSPMLDDACAEHRWFKPNESIKFSQVPHKFEDIDSLLMLLKLLCEEAESDLATPQMLQHYNQVVTTKLMVMLKHNVSMITPTRHAPSFERLSNYIERNIKLELSAEQLAQHAGLSLRSLYMLFEKNARTTPKNYVRQKKLERVHAVLSDPQQPCPNVTAVALEYGFTHLGRFSELYKSTYGVLPSQSIRCRQPSSKEASK
ncbi:AraC family transcriptional regulator [Thauera sp. Sel9]|uniref:AraC family transcriptional regulator n=1 Tax=Thauera sp. Sel9 TaxID=2974299 RepID=UPI0021E1ABBA|nr:AraC family transcriptional regulator [Thauera sp. Sel9]MCV2219757.1 AraC family transcriptional regulator [Thauera sp. Sel9]